MMSEKINLNVAALTDDQCNEFRKMNASFNDMVRAIYEAGAESQRAYIQKLESDAERVRMTIERGDTYGDRLQSFNYIGQIIAYDDAIKTVLVDFLSGKHDDEVTRAAVAGILEKAPASIFADLKKQIHNKVVMEIGEFDKQNMPKLFENIAKSAVDQSRDMILELFSAWVEGGKEDGDAFIRTVMEVTSAPIIDSSISKPKMH